MPANGHSWASRVLAASAATGVPYATAWGIGLGQSAGVRKRWHLHAVASALLDMIGASLLTMLSYGVWPGAVITALRTAALLRTLSS